MKNTHEVLLLEAIVNIYKTLYNVTDNIIEVIDNKALYHNTKDNKYIRILSFNRIGVLELINYNRYRMYSKIKVVHHICRCLFDKEYFANDLFLKIPKDVRYIVEASKYNKDELLLWLKMNGYNID